MTEAAATYVQARANFQTGRFEYLPGFFLDITYRYDSDEDKQHWRIITITDNTSTGTIAKLTQEILPHDELMTYLFHPLKYEHRVELLKRLNQILVSKCSEQEQAQLPGRYPSLQQLRQEELNAMTKQQFQAYCDAHEMFGTVFYPNAAFIAPRQMTTEEMVARCDKTRRDAEAFCRRMEGKMKISTDEMCPWTTSSSAK